MADDTTGWAAAKGDGVYWWRQGDHEPPDAVLVRGDVWYDFGDPEPTSVSLGKFLGPISPSDAEQLSELRRACEAALEYVKADVELLTCEKHERVSWCADCDSRVEAQTLADELSAALNPKQPRKETQ